MSGNPILQTLLSLTGQRNVITVHRPVVEFLNGSLEAALMLSQLLYWTPRSKMGGWVAKSDVDMQDELCLTRYGVRGARKYLAERGLISTKKAMFDGSPTTHYLVEMDALETQWLEHLLSLSENGQSEKQKADHCPKTDNPLSEIEQSLTETTTEIKSTAATSAPPVEENDTTQKIYTVYEQNIGALTPMIADRLKGIEEDYGAHWFTEAVMEAVANNARNLRYVETILARWQRDGFKSDKRQRKGNQHAKPRSHAKEHQPHGQQNAGADPIAEREAIERIKRRKARQHASV